MVESVNDVLSTVRDAAKGATARNKIPSPLSKDEIHELRVLKKLLKPFAILTDQLQSENVTSSLVIMGFIHAVQGMFLSSLCPLEIFFSFNFRL